MALHANRREILLVLGTCLFTCSVLVPLQLRVLQTPVSEFGKHSDKKASQWKHHEKGAKHFREDSPIPAEAGGEEEARPRDSKEKQFRFEEKLEEQINRAKEKDKLRRLEDKVEAQGKSIVEEKEWVNEQTDHLEDNLVEKYQNITKKKKNEKFRPLEELVGTKINIIEENKLIQQEIGRQQEEIRQLQELRRLQAESTQGMLGTDISVHPASIGRFWADLSSATARQSSTWRTSEAGFAIDGNPGSASHTLNRHSEWWQVDFQVQMKVTGLEILLRHKGGGYQEPPLAISVDGVQCGVITEFYPDLPRFVQFSTPCYGTTVGISQATKAAVYLVLYDVKIEVETSGGDDVRNVAAIICPFLSTLVFHHVLRGCVHTNETLLEATLAAGLEESKAKAHITANFMNIPSGRQDICNMEGAPNEHITSTGCCDCETFFTSCQQRHGDVPASCKTLTLEKSCGAPNTTKFENFWDKCKNGNTSLFLTKTELNNCEGKVDFNDGNPNGLGNISGSFGLLIDIFGHNGAIHKFNLREVILQRRFPPGYQYGRLSG